MCATTCTPLAAAGSRRAMSLDALRCLSGCPANRAAQAPSALRTFGLKLEPRTGASRRDSSTPSSLLRRMRPETDACPIGTRGAAVAGLASCQYRVPRMSARRRRGAATGGSPVGRSCICLPRAARRDRGWRRDETISCLHEKRCVAAGTVDDAEWLSHAVGLRLPMGQAAHWRDRSYLGLRCRPAASCGCPTV